MRRGVRLKGIKYVTKPNGKRYVYRRVNGALIPLPDLPENDPRFLAAYAKAGEAKPMPKSRGPVGSIADLCVRYLRSYEYSRLAPSSQKVWRRTVDRISAERGAGMLKDLRPAHIRKDVRALSPGAASNRLKAWRSLMKHAVAEGLIEDDPTIGVSAPKGKVTPHRQWTADEIKKYRDHYAIGTAERTAFEVIYWSGARCIDAVTLGWQLVSPSGWLTYTQIKTGGPATCPISDKLPAWANELSADQRMMLDSLPRDGLQWIVTQTGKPRSVKGLSQWISQKANDAGLPKDCTAHGLRKARAARLAEIGATAHQIGAWTGHASLSEIAHYTREADQKTILQGVEQEQNLGNSVVEFPK